MKFERAAMDSWLQKLPSVLTGNLCFFDSGLNSRSIGSYSMASMCRDLVISENVCDLKIVDFTILVPSLRCRGISYRQLLLRSWYRRMFRAYLR